MTTTVLTLPAPAKLNLFLHIVSQRSDGYHELQTIFQMLDFGDELTFNVTPTNALSIRSNNPLLESDDNLVIKAALLLQKTFNITLGADIYLDKKLPMGGGIGGGSSDCATTLIALNELWGIHCTKQKLMELALTLGADVPVFVNGHTAWAEGIGEQLTNIQIPEQWYLLIHPDQHVSTPELFAHPQLTRDTPTSTIRAVLAETGHNDFEPLVRSLYPAVNEAFQICEALQTCKESSNPKLTGSGSCFYMCMQSEGKAREALVEITRINPSLSGYVVKGMNISPALTSLVKAVEANNHR